MISVTLSEECYPTDSATEDVVSVQGGHMVIKQGFIVILLGGGRLCCAERQLKAHGGEERPVHSLRVIQVNRRDGQVFRQTEMTKFSLMTNTSPGAHRTLASQRDEGCSQLRASGRAVLRHLICRGLYEGYRQQHDAFTIYA